MRRAIIAWVVGTAREIDDDAKRAMGVAMDAEWKKMLTIHVDGAFLTTRACPPHMYRAGRAA